MVAGIVTVDGRKFAVLLPDPPDTQWLILPLSAAQLRLPMEPGELTATTLNRAERTLATHQTPLGELPHLREIISLFYAGIIAWVLIVFGELGDMIIRGFSAMIFPPTQYSGEHPVVLLPRAFALVFVAWYIVLDMCELYLRNQKYPPRRQSRLVRELPIIVFYVLAIQAIKSGSVWFLLSFSIAILFSAGWVTSVREECGAEADSDFNEGSRKEARILGCAFLVGFALSLALAMQTYATTATMTLNWWTVGFGALFVFATAKAPELLLSRAEKDALGIADAPFSRLIRALLSPFWVSRNRATH